MIKSNVENILNEQINAELYSAYLYLSMSAYAEVEGLKGCANWLHIQAQEEMAHAMGLYTYVLSRKGVPVMKEIAAPPTKWESILELFKAVLAHEELVTSKINNIATLAAKEDDHALYSFIQWYVKEQVEEEDNANAIIDQLKFAGHTEGSLYMIDKDLGTRVFVAPVIA